MATRRRIFKKYLIASAASAAAATVTFQTLNSNSIDSPFINGLIRSSRAFTTITSTVLDYKYSLQNSNPNTDEYSLALSQLHLRSAKRILSMCEANKGIYIKAGQFVSGVKQVPKEYSTLFSSLHDQSLPYDFKVIEQVLINNLGQNCLSDIFLSFDEDPVSAASIAQVHHAVLKNREEVAVKLMYPGLEYQMKFDLVIMSLLSHFVGWIFPGYRFHWLVSEFEKSIASELDFVIEGKNLERVKENFKGNLMVKVPNVYWEFTTRQVLTMEFCRGCKVDDLDFMKQRRISEVKVAKTLAEVFAEMIFVHGFVHGDLHPGNILVCPEGKNGGFRLVLLDFGICKQLDEDFRLKYCELWEALVAMDSIKIQEIGECFGVGKYSRYFPVIFTGRTIDGKSSLGRGMSVEEKKNLKLELKSLKMEDISSFMESLPTDFLTVLRTDGLLRSLISKLGAPARVRLLAYAEYALYGLSLKADRKSDSSIGVMLFRFKTGLRYVQLRLLFGVLGLVSWLESVKHTSTRMFKDLLASASYVLPPNSVLDVSFGTSTSFSGEQIEELAMGLELSKQKFIWVLRDADEGALFTGGVRRKKIELPEGFEERVIGFGLVVRDWAPQLEILAHSSMGEFMSRCWWNSFIKSTSMGVPIATWPMHFDQPKKWSLGDKNYDNRPVCGEWEKSEELLTASTIENVVRKLMASEEDDVIRERAKILGEAIRRSIEKGGASRVELDSFVAHITR